MIGPPDSLTQPKLVALQGGRLVISALFFSSHVHIGCDRNNRPTTVTTTGTRAENERKHGPKASVHHIDAAARRAEVCFSQPSLLSRRSQNRRFNSRRRSRACGMPCRQLGCSSCARVAIMAVNGPGVGCSSVARCGAVRVWPDVETRACVTVGSCWLESSVSDRSRARRPLHQWNWAGGCVLLSRTPC